MWNRVDIDLDDGSKLEDVRLIITRMPEWRAVAYDHIGTELAVLEPLDPERSLNSRGVATLVTLDDRRWRGEKVGNCGC